MWKISGGWRAGLLVTVSQDHNMFHSYKMQLSWFRCPHQGKFVFVEATLQPWGSSRGVRRFVPTDQARKTEVAKKWLEQPEFLKKPEICLMKTNIGIYRYIPLPTFAWLCENQWKSVWGMKCGTFSRRQAKIAEFNKKIEFLIPASEPPRPYYVSSALCVTELRTDPSRSVRHSLPVLESVIHDTNPSGLHELRA